MYKTLHYMNFIYLYFNIYKNFNTIEKHNKKKGDLTVYLTVILYESYSTYLGILLRIY